MEIKCNISFKNNVMILKVSILFRIETFFTGY